MSHLLRDDFVLSDEWATEHITIEDALSHRTGYPRHDLAFADTVREKVRLLRHLPMSAEPRVKFQYNNFMYATAGYLIETLTGKWLGDFFREYLWRPMGMNETFLGLYDPAFKASGLYAADGYYYKESTDEFFVTTLVNSPTSEGDGGIVSNVLDYVKYLRVMMAEAGPISKAGHRELKSPRSFWDLSGPPYIAQPTYSMGWASGVLQEEKVWFHSGTVSAFMSEMLMIPSREMGIVLMANSVTPARELVLYRILYDMLSVDEEKRYDFEAE
jgi:CubicO group peptidase (beta-lactamase class C family)